MCACACTTSGHVESPTHLKMVEHTSLCLKAHALHTTPLLAPGQSRTSQSSFVSVPSTSRSPATYLGDSSPSYFSALSPSAVPTNSHNQLPYIPCLTPRHAGRRGNITLLSSPTMWSWKNLCRHGRNRTNDLVMQARVKKQGRAKQDDMRHDQTR